MSRVGLDWAMRQTGYWLWVMGNGSNGSYFKIGSRGSQDSQVKWVGSGSPIIFLTPVHISLLLKLKITEYT